MSQFRPEAAGRINLAGPLMLVLLFAGVAVWLALRPQQAAPEYSPYSSISPAKDGTLALYSLLDELGYAPKRFVDTEYRYPKQACMLALQADDEFSVLFSGGL